MRSCPFPLHTKPGCMFLSSHLSPKSCSSHTTCRHIRELRSVENETYNPEAQIHGCKPIHPSYVPRSINKWLLWDASLSACNFPQWKIREISRFHPGVESKGPSSKCPMPASFLPCLLQLSPFSLCCCFKLS